MSIYPNPVNDILNISFDSKELAHATLMDISGVIVTEFDILNGESSLNTSSMSEGIYFMNIKSGNGVSYIKVNVKH